MNIKKNAFYIIKNEFFDKVQDSSLPFLKNGRPSFYCIEDKNNKNIIWVIPMTSKIEKVNKIIEKQGGVDKCNIYYINPTEKASAFNIQDIFPITINYIEREYTKNGRHYILKNIKLIHEVEKRAKILINAKMLKKKMVENEINVQKIYKFLQKELIQEKIETIKNIIKNNGKDQYNCLTGNQIQIPERENGENRWIPSSVIEKEGIQLKKGKESTEGLLCGRDADGLLMIKIVKYYNLSDIVMTKELEQKLVPMREVIQEKEVKKEREQEIEMDL